MVVFGFEKGNTFCLMLHVSVDFEVFYRDHLPPQFWTKSGYCRKTIEICFTVMLMKRNLHYISVVGTLKSKSN